MKKILIVIPAYNEEESIEIVYNKIINYNKEHNTSYDVLVINDCSKDNTGKILDDNKIPHIDLIQNLGIGGAVQTGYKYAKQNDYDIAVQFDGDGQHDINYVKDLIQPIICAESDMVIGSRFVGNESKFKSTASRRLGIKLISAIVKTKTKTRILDVTSGFRAINKNILNLFYNEYPIEYPEPISTVNVLSHGFIVKEISVKMSERQGGISSITSWKSIYYMLNVIISIILMNRRKY